MRLLRISLFFLHDICTTECLPRHLATTSGRIRCTPLAITVSAWKECSSRQSSNDVKIRKAAREPSHEDSRTAWSCLLWSRDVRVTPTSRCDFALTVWRACAVRRYCAQQESVSFVQRTHFAGLTRGTDPERGAFNSSARWCRRWWFGSSPCP